MLIMSFMGASPAQAGIRFLLGPSLLGRMCRCRLDGGIEDSSNATTIMEKDNLI